MFEPNPKIVNALFAEQVKCLFEQMIPGNHQVFTVSVILTKPHFVLVFKVVVVKVRYIRIVGKHILLLCTEKSWYEKEKQ